MSGQTWTCPKCGGHDPRIHCNTFTWSGKSPNDGVLIVSKGARARNRIVGNRVAA